MKSVFSILCFSAFLCSLPSFAQNKSRISFGPEAALAVNILPETSLGSNAALGGTFGIKANYALKKGFSISTGIYYSEKSMHYSSSYTTPTPSLNTVLNILASTQNLPFDPSKAFNTDSKVSIDGQINEHFIEIPVLCKYQHEGISIFAGPYIGFLGGAKNKQVKETTVPFVETVNFQEIAGGGIGGFLISSLAPPAYKREESVSHSTTDLNKYDFGVTAGIGYEFEHLNFNLSYSQGFLDYRQNRGDASKAVFKTLRFSVAYILHPRKREAIIIQ